MGNDDPAGDIRSECGDIENAARIIEDKVDSLIKVDSLENKIGELEVERDELRQVLEYEGYEDKNGSWEKPNMKEAEQEAHEILSNKE